MFKQVHCAEMSMEQNETEKGVLPKKLGGGPFGLGDPDDRSLRKVEVEVLIPKKMREKARVDNCAIETEAFNKCCKDASLAMVIKCRKENAALKDCLGRWYSNEAFKQQCTEEYLQERSEFRRTGKKPDSKK
ncbi:hypothetical protein R5R35_012944 [Gryllus longicercus]|uniref:COX assembly mitochondrial protein n=1 Tax=Gryllus longicercus TaxID=2509291 RepID=A0AAN9ZID3_9ORTH